MSRRRLLVVCTTFALLGAAIAVPVVARPDAAAAGPADNFALTKSDDLGGEVLIGEQVTYTLTASGTQSSGNPLYNLSFRDVLPVGVSFVSGDPAPTAVLADVPASGQTTVIWSNAMDLPANSLASVSYVVETNPDFAGGTTGSTTVPVGAVVTNSAEAGGSLDAFRIPDWSPTTGEFTGDVDGSATTSHNVSIIPFRVTKVGPGELLRGVHDNGFGARSGTSGDTWTIEVENNPDYATDAVTLSDVLGPELEFLGCDTYYSATDDNSTDVPFRESTAAADEEWAGSGRMATGTGPCATPLSVDTVDAGLGGGLANTVVDWDLGNLTPGQTVTVTYRAGIPMRANTTTWTTVGGAPAANSLNQGHNLDNNAGPSTNEVDRTLSPDPELLVDGAPGAANTASALGTYTPDATEYGGSDQTSTEAEDITIGKAMTGTLVHGGTVSTDLTIATGEYRDFTTLVVRDLLPSALCYTGLLGADLTPGGSDWATNDCPGAGSGAGSATSVRELPDGGPYGSGRFEVVWGQTSVPGLADLDSDSSLTISYSAVVRTTYRGGLAALPSEPILAGDVVTNEVEVSGPDFIVAGHTNDGGADDEAAGGLDGDTASAQLENSLPTIDKRISAKAGPLADGANATGATCLASHGSITWQDSVATGFGPGDIVCFELSATFPTLIDYENVVIQDLMPPGYSYVTGSAARVTPDDNLPGASFDDTTLRWDLGTVANAGHQFRWVLAGQLGAPDAAAAGDIHANLQKLIHNQSGGIVYQYRDETPATWTEPQLDLVKGVKSVDASDNSLDRGPEGPDVDGSATGGTTSIEVQADAAVTFRVDVTNNGNKDALNTEARDILPPDLSCAEVSAISNSGTCGSGTISWAVPSIAAGASTELTYVLTMPTDAVAGETWLNAAGVRTYQAATNTGTTAYYPADNIDPGVTPNTTAADDTARIHTATPGLAKTQASGIDEAGNGSNGTPDTSLDRATIGEIVEYTITLTIPDGTRVIDGVMSDALHSSLRYFEGSADFGGSIQSLAPSVVSTAVDADGDRLDSGALATPAAGSSGTVTYTLPGDYRNVDGSGDDVVTITFYVQLMSSAAGNNRDNTASFDYDDTASSPLPTVDSNQVRTLVVEPSPATTKTHTDPVGAVVAPGDIVTYQVVAENQSGTNVSVLHNAEIVDTVPVGISPRRSGGGLVSADGHLVDATGVSPVGSFTGVWSETNRTISWTGTDWAPLASMDPGTSLTFTYQAEVDDPATASDSITNTAELTGSSLDGTDPNVADGRFYSTTDTDLLTLPSATFVKDIEPLPSDATDRATVTVGESLDFDISVSLPADTRAFDLTLFDDLPAQSTFDSFGAITVSGPCELVPGGGPLTNTDIETFAPVGGRADLVAWFLGDVLANGGSCDITVNYTVHIDHDAVAADMVTNTAHLRWNSTDLVADSTPTSLPADYDDPADSWDVDGGSDPESILVIEPQLEIDEDVTLADLTPLGLCDTTAGNNRTGANDTDSQAGPTDGCDINAGDSLRFTVTVINSGTADAHDTVAVQNLPAGVTPLTAPGGALATDGATITGSSGSTGTWNATARTVTWSLTGPIAASGGTATVDTHVRVDGSATLTEGQDLTTNADIDTYHALDAGTRAGIAPGRLPVYGNGGPATRGGLLADTTTVEVHFPQLTIAKSALDDDTDARFDAPFTWRLVIENASTSAPAFEVDATDTLPAGWSYDTGSARISTPYGGPTGVEPTIVGQDLTWAGLVAGGGQPLAAGAQITIEFDAIPSSAVLAPDPATGITNTGPTNPHTNSAAVAGEDASGATGCCDTGGGPQAYGDNDLASAVIRRSDVSVTKAVVDTAPIYYGDVVTYVITVTNDGPGPATGVSLTDVLAADHTWVATDRADAGTFDDTSATWTVGAVPNGTSYELHLRVEINDTGSVTNIAAVTAADQWDPDSTPDNAVPAEDDEDTVTITALDTDLGNRVWLDLNSDGVQDGSEPGIPGVDVYVSWTDAEGSLQVRSDTTDNDGNWQVNGLPVNTALTVTVDPANPASPAGTGSGGATRPGGLAPTWELDDNPVVTNPQAGNGHMAALDHETTGIVLTPTTDTYVDVDFGYVGINSVGDELWFDADAGGEAFTEADDQPLVGVSLDLTWAGFDGVFGTGDDLHFAAVTDASGKYSITGLPDGLYRGLIDETTLPTGVAPAYDLDGIGSAHDSGSFPLGTTQVPAHDRTDVDFSYLGSASLGDTVWFDVNGDGVFDTNEVPLAGVVVTASFTLPGGVVTTVQTTTDTDGLYRFDGMPIDTPIAVTIDNTTLPVGLEPTHDLDGIGTAHTTEVTLTGVVPVRLDVDFGYAGMAELGDLVWLDTDSNGAATPDTGEPGLAEATVTLTWPNPTGAADLVLTTTTDTNGNYLFTGLAAGVHTVTLSNLPVGTSATFDADGGNDLTSDRALTASESALDQDFSVAGSSSLGDTIWEDTDGDGIQDAGESGLPGVEVTVVWTDPDTGATATWTAVTDPDGHYLVGGLPAGEYVVTIDPATLPAGFGPTHDLDGITSPDRAELTLTAATDQLDVDFGYQLQADLAVTKTHNGDFRLGEQNQWTVTVTNHGPAPAAAPVTVTDDLPAGLAFVRTETTGWTCTEAADTVSCVYTGAGTTDTTLAVSSTTEIVIVVIPDTDAAPGLTNTASVSSPTADPDTENNETDDPTSVPLAQLTIDKTLIGNLRARGTASYQLTVVNAGPSPSNGTITVIDDLPTQLSYESSSPPSGVTCTMVGRSFQCTTTSSLAIDESLVIELTTSVSSSATGSVANTATVAGGNDVGGTPLSPAALGASASRSDTANVTVGTAALSLTGASITRLVTASVLLLLTGAAIIVGVRRRYHNAPLDPMGPGPGV